MVKEAGKKIKLQKESMTPIRFSLAIREF